MSNPTAEDNEYLDARFVLVSYYNRCRVDDPCWEVYGHIKLGHNECIGSYKREISAIKMAMKYAWIGVPVVAGSRNHWEPILKKVLGRHTNQRLTTVKEAVNENIKFHRETLKNAPEREMDYIKGEIRGMEYVLTLIEEELQ